MPRLGRGTASASLLFQDFFRPLVKSTRTIGGVIHNPIALFTFPDLSKLIFDCEANSTIFVHLKTSIWSKVFFTVPGTAKDMDRQLPIFTFFGWPLFVKGSSVAKILELYESTRCQIKDMDIVFPQVPHYPVLAKWFGYCDSIW